MKLFIPFLTFCLILIPRVIAIEPQVQLPTNPCDGSNILCKIPLTDPVIQPILRREDRESPEQLDSVQSQKRQSYWKSLQFASLAINAMRARNPSEAGIVNRGGCRCSDGWGYAYIYHDSLPYFRNECRKIVNSTFERCTDHWNLGTPSPNICTRHRRRSGASR